MNIKWNVLGEIPSNSGGEPWVIKIHPVTGEVGCNCWPWRRSGKAGMRHCQHTEEARRRGLIPEPTVDMQGFMLVKIKMRKDGYAFWTREFEAREEKAKERWPEPDYVVTRVARSYTAFCKREVE